MMQRPVLVMLFCSALVTALNGQNISNQSSTNILERGRALRAKHQFQDGVSLLQPYLASHPNDVDALTLLGQLQIDLGDVSGAQRSLITALTANPTAIAPNLTMGNLLLAGHHNPEAMDRFETVLSSEPHNAAARNGELNAATELAVIARSAGHPEACLQVLQHARISLPDDTKLLYELGMQALELNMLPYAAEALGEAQKLNPGDLDTLYALARVEIEQQHMAAAEADLHAYLANRPNDASAHYGLGHVFAMDQRTDEARAEFERSLQLQPAQTESYYQLGQIELDAQHDDKAISLFLKALARDPAHGGALAGMGILAFRAKDYAQAEKFLAAAERASPSYGPAHYYRGLSLDRLGKKDEAEAELKTATDLGRAAAAPVGSHFP